MASRHLARSIAMQSLYEWDFYNEQSDLTAIVERNLKEFGPGLEEVNQNFVRNLAKGVAEKLPQLNTIIEKAAPEWPIGQINLTDRNVLRLGLFELLYSKKEEVPPKVAITKQ